MPGQNTLFSCNLSQKVFIKTTNFNRIYTEIAGIQGTDTQY